jgi:hypothetical protein
MYMEGESVRLIRAWPAIALTVALVVLTHEGFLFFRNYRAVSAAVAVPANSVKVIGKALARVKLERIWRKEEWRIRGRQRSLAGRR